jgi:prophage regulatory protein
MKQQVAAPIQPVYDRQLTILRLPQVKARTGRSRSSIYADIKAGRFVAPISIGRRSVGWLAHEVDAWIAARVAESRQAG